MKIAEGWREAIATAAGCETADVKTVNELLECDPAGACETHGRCWTHSEWQRCRSTIRSISDDPCTNVADGLDGMCEPCRAFDRMCEQNDKAQP